MTNSTVYYYQYLTTQILDRNLNETDHRMVQEEEEEDDDLMTPVISITVPILFAIIVIVGLVGNSLVVIVVKCNPQMCSTTNMLIINLAVADLLFIIFCVPFTAWDYAFPYWPFGGIWCKVVQYLIVVCAYASIYTVSSDNFCFVTYRNLFQSLNFKFNSHKKIVYLLQIQRFRYINQKFAKVIGKVLCGYVSTLNKCVCVLIEWVRVFSSSSICHSCDDQSCQFSTNDIIYLTTIIH